MISKNVITMAMIVAGFAIPALSSGANAAQLDVSKTEVFKEKEGFKRDAKDIMNTLKDNDVDRFTQFIEGLNNAMGLDATLKNGGPFTVFAPDDKALKHLPDDDWHNLMNNPKKMKQVLSYHIVKGKMSLADLSKLTSIKTLEGQSIKLGSKESKLTTDNASVTKSDIPCANGVIHIIDRIIMPPLSK